MLQINIIRFTLVIRTVVVLYFSWFLSQNRDIAFPFILQEYILLGFVLENILILTLYYYSLKRPSLIVTAISMDVLAGIFLFACFKGNIIWLVFLLQPALASGALGVRASLLVSFIQFFAYWIVLEINTQHTWQFSLENAFFGIVVFIGGILPGLTKEIYDIKAKQSDSLLSLIESGQELGTTVTFDTVFSHISTIVKSLFSCHTCVVYLRDPREEFMKLCYTDSPYEKLFIDFDPNTAKSILSKAMKEKKGIVVPDLGLRDDEELIPKAKLIRSVMAVPFVFQGGVFGGIIIAHQTPNQFKDESLNLFTILANQAAISIRNIQLHEATATMAVTDSVSGLFTHGYFQDSLEKEFQRCKYANLPLSLIIMDVDHFKLVNDTYGHPQGDAILRQVGGVIRSVTRGTDVVCRYGGDEFTITLTETNRIGAVLVAERIRKGVEEYEFVSGGKVLHISVSGGVASFPEDISTRKELIEKADQALYEAKKQGRNRICFSA